MIGFGFASLGWKSGASFVNQSQSAVKQNPRKAITKLISTLNWKPFYNSK